MSAEGITPDSVADTATEDIRRYAYGLIEVHVDYTSLDRERFTYLLGYYPAIYSHLSELYTVLISAVREAVELGDRFTAARRRDRRDVLEEALKALKLQYDSLSRKITLFQSEV